MVRPLNRQCRQRVSRNTRMSSVDSGHDHYDTTYPLMRLTDYTDYSLRVMLFLAVRGEGLTTIQEISDAYGVSKNHLMKVVQQLGELGWIETVRGRNGGLRLNANSMALTVGEVVRATENDFALVGCFPSSGEADSHRHCVIESQCRLKDVFTAARSAFFAELDRHTISELAQPSAQLATLLGMIPIKVIPADAPIGAPIPASAAG
jgi:Rrf2 family nitric oxide-sensitive transcriptional repressor